MSNLFDKFTSIIPDKLPELCNAFCALSLKYCKVGPVTKYKAN